MDKDSNYNPPIKLDIRYFKTDTTYDDFQEVEVDKEVIERKKREKRAMKAAKKQEKMKKLRLQKKNTIEISMIVNEEQKSDSDSDLDLSFEYDMKGHKCQLYYQSMTAEQADEELYCSNCSPDQVFLFDPNDVEEVQKRKKSCCRKVWSCVKFLPRLVQFAVDNTNFKVYK